MVLSHCCSALLLGICRFRGIPSLKEQQKLMNGWNIAREEGKAHLLCSAWYNDKSSYERLRESIQHNIDSSSQKGHIDETNKQYVINGQLAEIRSNTSPDVVTVGIDLNETDGLRIVSGDAAAQRRGLHKRHTKW